MAVSSALRPCLANSAAPSATVSNVCPVSLATLNIEALNLVKVASVAWKIEFIYISLFSTSIVVETNFLND